MRTEAEDRIAAALQLLYRARDQLKAAKCPRATAKVRAAITSTQGAARHAYHAAARVAAERPMRRHRFGAHGQRLAGTYQEIG